MNNPQKECSNCRHLDCESRVYGSGIGDCEKYNYRYQPDHFTNDAFLAEAEKHLHKLLKLIEDIACEERGMLWTYYPEYVAAKNFLGVEGYEK